MPTERTLERFIARVESNAHAAAIAEFYAEHGQMRENQSAPRVGRANLIAHEESVLKRARSVESTCVRPVFVSGPLVVIRWIFRFQWLRSLPISGGRASASSRSNSSTTLPN
jgi:hypothetical protein